MDSRISIGDKLELEKIETRISADPDKSRQIYYSQVLDEGEFEDFFVAMPIQEGKVIPLSVDQEFDATFYTKPGLMRCRVKVTGRYKKGSLFLLKLSPLTTLQKVQRREYFRFECRNQIEYRIVKAEEERLIESETEYDMEQWQSDWNKAIMLDLSGGGIYFVSANDAPKNALLQVRFDILIGDMAEVVYAFGKILRIERNQNNKSIYDYHIKFSYMSQGLREKIIRFIFEEQRRKRSKQIGNE